MRKPIEQYLIEQLELLVDEFPNIQINCRYDNFDNTFCVQLLPEAVYNENRLLLHKRSDLLSNLIRLYPTESVGFYTEDSTILFDKFDYTLTGKDFVSNQLPAKKQKIEVVHPKRKRREPLHPYVSRAV